MTRLDDGADQELAVLDDVVEYPTTPGSATSAAPSTVAGEARHDSLAQATVPMTVLAQDPSVVGPDGPILARIPVPVGRLQRGPRNHRFHVVDVAVGSNRARPPAVLHAADDPWAYVDRWAGLAAADVASAAELPEFRAQNVFAIAASTLALFERHLGRPIPWNAGYPQLYLIPQARVEANAFYSREHNAVLFGWLPAISGRPAVYTALSYDIVVHEVTHAILDGLRPRYTEPSLPDQLAVHESLADLVAMLSVFGLDGVAQHVLDPSGSGLVPIPAAASADTETPEQVAAAEEGLRERRARFLMRSPLALLAEQLGGEVERTKRADGPALADAGRYAALRRSVEMVPSDDWKTKPEFESPHRRAEVLVAAFMQTLVSMWAARLDPLRVRRGGMDAGRVAEEGTKAAEHLLGMLLRALDYLPPVDLEFADVLDSVLTADRRLSPDDRHGYRDALRQAFERFGIVSPLQHCILDEDGIVAPAVAPADPSGATIAAYPPDPDAPRPGTLCYEHLNFVALRSSPEEVYEFIWANAGTLQIDVRFTTRVERVLASTRVGPDGLILNEVLADYIQILDTTGAELPPGITRPEGVEDDTKIQLWGGGVLVFDQFGRFRLHQRQPLLDTDRQSRRLEHLVTHGRRDRHGGFGASDGVPSKLRFSLLHRDDPADR